MQDKHDVLDVHDLHGDLHYKHLLETSSPK
jgi:hypothetical protein